MRLRRGMLLLVIVCCVMAAVLPMTAWMLPFRSRVWLFETLLSLLLAVGSLGLIMLACLFAKDRGKWARIMNLGVVCAITSAVLLMVHAIYEGYQVVASRSNYGTFDRVIYHFVRPAGVTAFLAAAVAGQWCALSLLRLDRYEHRQFRNLVQYAAVLYLCVIAFITWGGAIDRVILVPAAVAILHAILLWAYMKVRRRSDVARKVANRVALGYAAILVVLFAWTGWIDPVVEWSYTRSTFGARGDDQITVGATVVIVAATAIVPLLAILEFLHRSMRSEVPLKSEQFDGICIHCGQRQAMRIGRNRCIGCGVIINVQIEEPRCECGYSLYQLQRETCPECGRKINI